AGRFSSAAEVADLLGRRLAQLQQPRPELGTRSAECGTEEASPSALRAPGSALRVPRSKRRLFAAALLLLAAAGPGLAEASGMTGLGGGTLGVLTAGGSLVVEVDDAQVKVTVEGDGGLVITGAGPQEVRLRPGDYRLMASKDGKVVREELVTITRGDRRV